MDSLTLRAGTGCAVVSADGGRVVELRPAHDVPNVLWHGTGAAIAGGDRMWPAPEVEHFYDDDGWRCPPEIDPGSWTLSGTADGQAELRQRAADAGFRRTVTPIEDLPVTSPVPWSGYRTTDVLETDRAWSAWHLVVVPAPARVFVGAWREPVDYYAPRPDEIEGWMDVRDEPPRWKIGFPAPEDGRVLLAALDGADPGGLVIMFASADPGGTYVDVPPRGGPATAVQVYSSGGLGFCELEHHAPVESRTATSAVVGAWGRRGERLELLDALVESPPSVP